MALTLVDVSNGQAVIDWKQVAGAGIAGAICKASEGIGYKDPTFDANWAGLHAQGMVRGCYHFARCDYNRNPIDEASWFLSQLPPLQPGDIVACDAEVGEGELSAWYLAWLRHVEQAIGFPPLLYTFPSYAIYQLTDPALARYPLWLAALDALPPRIGVWPSIALWQYNWHGRVPGIGPEVDMDLIYRTVEGLRQLGKPAPVPVTPPPPTPPVVWTKGRLRVSGAGKSAPNHTCAAIVQIDVAHSDLLASSITRVTNGESWTLIEFKAVQCWVLTKDISLIA